MKNSKQINQKKHTDSPSDIDKNEVPVKGKNDKTGEDKDADSTKIKKEADKFEKPKRETNPDSTGIDKDSDKTKKEK